MQNVVWKSFLNALAALCQNPTATLKVNYMSSGAIQVKLGTRQGCPLSLFLFALAIEPLDAHIRSHPDIKGIKIGNKEHKMSLYPDDIVLYITLSLPVLQITFQDLAKLSSLKVNCKIRDISYLYITCGTIYIV